MRAEPDRRGPLQLFRPLLTTVAVVALALMLLGLVTPRPDFRRQILADARQWSYQLQNVANSLGSLRNSASDMLVIDYAVDRGNGLEPLTKAEVDRLKRKPDGSRRLVIAYFSVGEAEEYRPYWNASWSDQKPGFIIAENCRWPKNHLVKFWDEGWRKIIYDGGQSYLAQIQDAGFDGVYLDRVDVYADIADRYPETRQKMLQFVTDLANAARTRDPGFLVIVQNAEELLSDRNYRRTIDGLAKEDLLYGVNGTGRRNPKEMVEGSLAELAKLDRDGKPVFAVEYLNDPAAIKAATLELQHLGYSAVFPPRSLDGSDPLAKASATAASEETGTPEFAQSRCDGVWKRGGV